MALTRRGFLTGAGGACLGAAAGTDAPRGEAGAFRDAVHDPNLMVFLSDIHLHDDTARWKNAISTR